MCFGNDCVLILFDARVRLTNVRMVQHDFPFVVGVPVIHHRFTERPSPVVVFHDAPCGCAVIIPHECGGRVGRPDPQVTAPDIVFQLACLRIDLRCRVLQLDECTPIALLTDITDDLIRQNLDCCLDAKNFRVICDCKRIAKVRRYFRRRYCPGFNPVCGNKPGDNLISGQALPRTKGSPVPVAAFILAVRQHESSTTQHHGAPAIR